VPGSAPAGPEAVSTRLAFSIRRDYFLLEKNLKRTNMEICVNGEKEFLARPATIADVLAARGNDVNRVVVEINGGIVPREKFADTPLREGDVLEVVHFVGGG
jgi:thiamine biosynthesis protein ThiS